MNVMSSDAVGRTILSHQTVGGVVDPMVVFNNDSYTYVSEVSYQTPKEMGVPASMYEDMGDVPFLKVNMSMEVSKGDGLSVICMATYPLDTFGRPELTDEFEVATKGEVTSTFELSKEDRTKWMGSVFSHFLEGLKEKYDNNKV